MAILNDSDILDKMILEKIFRYMKCGEFYRLSRALLEKTRTVGSGIVISMIRKYLDFFSSSFFLDAHGYCGDYTPLVTYQKSSQNAFRTRERFWGCCYRFRLPLWISRSVQPAKKLDLTDQELLIELPVAARTSLGKSWAGVHGADATHGVCLIVSRMY